MLGGVKQLTVYIIHSLPLKMSIVQVFVGDQMTLVAHLVYNDTIGKPEYYQGIKSKVNYVANTYNFGLMVKLVYKELLELGGYIIGLRFIWYGIGSQG